MPNSPFGELRISVLWPVAPIISQFAVIPIPGINFLAACPHCPAPGISRQRSPWPPEAVYRLPDQRSPLRQTPSILTNSYRTPRRPLLHPDSKTRSAATALPGQFLGG